MILAKIVGTVVATRKDPRLVSSKLLVARPIDPARQGRRQLPRRRRHRRRRRRRDRAHRQRQLGAHGVGPEGLSRSTPPSSASSTPSQVKRLDADVQLARVIGDVVVDASRTRTSTGIKLLVLQPLDRRRASRRPDARRGRLGRRRRRRERVLRPRPGSGFPFYPAEPPVDAAIVGIVDHWDRIDGAVGRCHADRAASSAPSSSTQKNRKFEGAKLLLVQPLTLDDTAARHGAARDRLGRRRRRREGAGRARRQGGGRGARQEGRRRRRRDHRHRRRGGVSSDESASNEDELRALVREAIARAARTPRRRRRPTIAGAAAAHVARQPLPVRAAAVRTARASSSRRCRAITAATASRTDTDVGLLMPCTRPSRPDRFPPSVLAQARGRALRRRSLRRRRRRFRATSCSGASPDKDALICLLTDRIDGEVIDAGAGAEGRRQRRRRLRQHRRRRPRRRAASSSPTRPTC